MNCLFYDYCVRFKLDQEIISRIVLFAIFLSSNALDICLEFSFKKTIIKNSIHPKIKQYICKEKCPSRCRQNSELKKKDYFLSLETMMQKMKIFFLKNYNFSKFRSGVKYQISNIKPIPQTFHVAT